MGAVHGEVDEAVESRLELVLKRSFSDVTAAEREQWSELARRSGAPIYQTPTWAEVWWQHYATRRELGVYFATRGSDIVGVVPMYVERLGWPPLGARVGKPVGADHSTSNFGFVGESTIAPLVLARVATDMIGSLGCDFVSYGPMLDAGPVSHAIADAGLVAGDVAVSTCPHTPGVLMRLDLRGGYDDFLGRLSKTTRRSLRRRRRQVETTPGVEIDRLEGRDAMLALPSFVDMHQSQWQALGREGHFDDWPAARAFHADVVASLDDGDEANAAVLYRASFEGEPIAYEYLHRHGAATHSLLAARNTGEPWASMSLGSALLLAMIEGEADRGTVTLDLGQGHYGYKDSLRASEVSLDRLRIVGSGLRRRAVAGASKRLAWSIHLIYYRIWFSRVKPRIGRQAPIARPWIRTRM